MKEPKERSGKGQDTGNAIGSNVKTWELELSAHTIYAITEALAYVIQKTDRSYFKQRDINLFHVKWEFIDALSPRLLGIVKRKRMKNEQPPENPIDLLRAQGDRRGKLKESFLADHAALKNRKKKKATKK